MKKLILIIILLHFIPPALATNHDASCVEAIQGKSSPAVIAQYDPDIETGESFTQGLAKTKKLADEIITARKQNASGEDNLFAFKLQDNLFSEAKQNLQLLKTLAFRTVEKSYNFQSNQLTPTLPTQTFHSALEKHDMFLINRTYLDYLDAVGRYTQFIRLTEQPYPNTWPAFSRDYFNLITTSIYKRPFAIWITTEKQSMQSILEYLANGIFVIELRLEDQNPGEFSAHDINHIIDLKLEQLTPETLAWLRQLLTKLDEVQNPIVKRLTIMQIISIREDSLILGLASLINKISERFYTYGDATTKLRDSRSEYPNLENLQYQSTKWIQSFLEQNPFPKQTKYQALSDSDHAKIQEFLRARGLQ